MKLLLALALILLLFAPSVAKACTAPAGVEGQFLFNHDYNLVQYCDANNVWVRLGGSTTDARIGTLTANKWCAANAGGTGLDCTQNAPTAGITALTGDVTASGSGSVAATIAANAVSYAKIQNTSTASVLLGRGSASGAGAVQELTLGSGLSLVGTVLSASASGTVSGTTNYVAKFTGATTVGNSQIFDNGTNVGIGTATPYTGGTITIHAGTNNNLMFYSAGLGALNDAYNGWTSLNLIGEPIIFSENGNEKMRIASGGNVGIGTASPKMLLDVNGVITAPGLIMNGYFDGAWRPKTAGYIGYIQMEASTGKMYFWNSTASVAADTAATLAARMTLDKDGNVGIGTTNPTTKLTIDAGASSNDVLRLYAPSGGGSYSGLRFDGGSGTWSLAAIRGLDAGSYNGELSFLLDVDGATTTSFTEKMHLYTSGNLWIGGTLTQNSDRRLKTNITNLTGALAKLSQINGVAFSWKNPTRGSGRQLGVIAQDVQKVYPELISRDGEGNLNVNYSGLTGPLIEAVHELKADNDDLRALVEQQGREIKALKASIH